MTDIVDRLNDSLSAGYSELRKEAAVEIMRLRNDYYALLQERDALRVEIEELHVLIAAVKKQAYAEFCLRVKKEEEYARLRAKIEQMERQEPIGWFARLDGDWPLMECKHADLPRVPLYARVGAQAAPEAKP